ncbi:MAG TPA: late competence development ComFB family protein [Desulfosalsimonadaceae bacterium]|nr:late competence development ComFB family protein [Desulfosalsimonadaceae bacterium]
MASGKKADRWQVRGVDLSRIRNRNERRVVTQMKALLPEYPDFEPDILAIQDIYALALNLLPARYAQEFTIVLNDPVSDENIRGAVREAIHRVRAKPTGASGAAEQGATD